MVVAGDDGVHWYGLWRLDDSVLDGIGDEGLMIVSLLWSVLDGVTFATPVTA